MNESEVNGLAVAVGRIEEGMKNLNDKMDRVIAQGDQHANTLSEHDTRLAVLESKQQPKVHWLTILVGIVAVAGFALAIFDRLYVG